MLYEKYLKKFQYKNALDAALDVSHSQLKNSFSLFTTTISFLQCTHPHPHTHPQLKNHPRRGQIIYALLQELARRDGLTFALSGRNEEELYPLLRYLSKFMTNPKYAPLLLDICAMLIGKAICVFTSY